MEIEENEEAALIEEFSKAMGFLEERYELEFQKLEMDYTDVLGVDS